MKHGYFPVQSRVTEGWTVLFALRANGKRVVGVSHRKEDRDVE